MEKTHHIPTVSTPAGCSPFHKSRRMRRREPDREKIHPLPLIKKNYKAGAEHPPYARRLTANIN